MKYLCDSEEKLINIHNLLKIDLNEIQLDKEYDINFNLKVNLLETNKVTALYYIHNNKKKNIREKNNIIDEYKKNLSILNKSIEKYNKSENKQIKNVELPELEHYDYERNYKNFKQEMFQKFFEIFFSAEFNPEIINTNNDSLSSLCDIISVYPFDAKYTDKVSNIIAANLMKTDNVNIMCKNLGKIKKKI